MKKNLILSLICIGLITIGRSTIFGNKSKQVKLYSNPNTSYLQIITNPICLIIMFLKIFMLNTSKWLL